MSRIGKKPVALPANVKVAVTDRHIVVESGSNKLSYTHRPEVTVKVDDPSKSVVVERRDDSRSAKAMHGLTRALIANMVTGVTTGFTKDLEINGVGWGATVQGNKVALNVGYADTRYVPIPTGVAVEVQGMRIKVKGADKQAVGQVAARIRAHKPPEPYNGKGIKYIDEQIIRKSGKAFAGGGA
jgi:large subunit ribosomal protein L6